MGRRFGKLVAVEELPKERGMRRWRLACDCGRVVETFQKQFASSGKMRSCGCDHAKPQIRHGGSTRPEYKHWLNLISRCENPGMTGFKDYGGRGIKVCARWRASFQHFLDDMGARPAPGYSVDRIDVNGDYTPENCRWATRTTQGRNKRFNRVVEVDGESMTLAEAVERRGLKYNTVLYRLLRGKSVVEALR
jgi:hypothetical protein